MTERAYVRGGDELTTVAASEPADWFIAHTQMALPAAAAAANHHRARLGFDCEDLLAESGTDPSHLVRRIERTYIPQCDYISAASHHMAVHLQETYGCKKPLVLYNTFPLRLADKLKAPIDRPAPSRIRLFWFSQTIGPGRGLEDAIQALGVVRAGIELHLLGRVSQDYLVRLRSQAAALDVGDLLFFHNPIDHDEIVNFTGGFDIGLALEQPQNQNYSRTVTNKIFAYLLAGLAVAATNTPGQREILDKVPEVGFLYEAGDPQALARRLEQWHADRIRLRQAQEAAWHAARNGFSWDHEQDKLLATLAEVKGKARRAGSQRA